MAVHAEALELQLLASGSDASRRRFQHLRRLLFVADAVTGVVAGALVGLVANASSIQTLVLAVVLAVAWPVAAFLCGLYAREDLRAWSSGVSEAPRLVLTCLAVSWPLFGLLASMAVDHPAAAPSSARSPAPRWPASPAPAPAWSRTVRRSCASAR